MLELNDQTFPWLTTLIVVPVVGAVVVASLRGTARRHARAVALGVSLLVALLAAVVALGFDTGDAATHQFTESVPWIPALGVTYALGMDGVGLALVLLSVVLVPLVILAAWREHPDNPGSGGRPVAGGARIQRYLALVLVLEAFMVSIFVARDVFLFYILFEAMLIPVYFMIGAFGGLRRRYAALKFLLYSLAGGLIMLVGVIALYLHGPRGPEGFLVENLVGGTDMSTTVERLIFLSFFLAFAIKAPMWPVHTWLPDAAEQAPAGTSVLLVGVLDKVGTFGMLTLCLPLFPEASRWAAPAIIVLAVISILYGALLAIGQQDLLRLIAYTSVSHFGFIVLGIFAFTSTSIAGSSLYMFNHGISTGALFLLAGFLVVRRGTARIPEFGGMQKVTPVLAGTFLLTGLSALSLPGLSPFVSELMVLVGTFSRNRPAAVFAVLGVILAAIYVLLTYQRIFTGPVRPELADARDLSRRERWVIGPLVALLLVLGFYPAPALDLLRDPASASLEHVGVDDPPPVVGNAVEAATTGTATTDGSDQ